MKSAASTNNDSRSLLGGMDFFIYVKKGSRKYKPSQYTLII